ncbi:hypothetical protein [Agrococcus jejuensis]|uniref:Uncharacterized protein n=1 Tax=Agrococcus jejuensis TaxID=399736 RepID=A0A1G8GPK5_9MICO|nr:hypothetical protein [Agrococcus jejuensis]SDH96324.1 hypothetical protein SAMN04489720_3018 [Agrococcus jejuensis]
MVEDTPTHARHEPAPHEGPHDVDAHAVAVDLVDADDAIHLELERELMIDPSNVEAVTRLRKQTLALLRPAPLRSYRWPDSWYIPGGADYREHWILPPELDHRYAWQAKNLIGGQSAGSFGDAQSGAVFGWSNASSLDADTIGFGRVGAYVRPATTLATYELSASIEALSEWRWQFLPSAGASPWASFHYRCTAYVLAWLVSPVDGSWELLRPFGARTLLRQQASGQGEFAVQRRSHAFSDLSVRVQLEGGRTYAVGVSFEAQATPSVVDRDGRPYVRRPEDRTLAYAGLSGRVPRIVARRVVTHIA